MSDLFVPYKIALLAKKKGFDELCYMTYNPCVRVWFQQGTGLIGEGNLRDKQVLAPMYQQLINWFREKHSIHIRLTKFSQKWHWKIQILAAIDNKDIVVKGYSGFIQEYDEALDKALIEAFKLIK